MTAATAGRVRGVLGRVWGGIMGGQHRGRFGLTRGVVGFCFAYAVLHIPSFHKHDVVRPVLGDILYTQDVLEFFTQGMVQGCILCCIIPIEICN
jgi:hypothetical protein